MPNLTLMVPVMDKIVTERGLSAEFMKNPYDILLAVFGQAKTAAALHPETIHPVTELAWLTVYDAAMSDTFIVQDT